MPRSTVINHHHRGPSCCTGIPKEKYLNEGEADYKRKMLEAALRFLI